MGIPFTQGQINSFGNGQTEGFRLHNATQAWSGIKAGAGLGTAATGAGLAGTLGSLGAFAASPFGMLILSQIGMPLLGKLFGGQSATDKALSQQTAIGKTLIPQLQQQAAGGQTAATKAQGNMLNQQVQKAMQSQAASASRSMPGGSSSFMQTTPARAAQGRLQGSRIEGMANIMGQSQMNAQNQLSALYQGGVATQAQQETSNLQARSQVGEWLGQIMNMQKTGGLDDTDKELFDALKEAIRTVNEPMKLGNTGNTGNTVTGNTRSVVPDDSKFGMPKYFNR